MRVGRLNSIFPVLYVNNMKVYPDDGSGVLSQALAFTNGTLDLSSEQNNIMINFSNSNYVELEGKDEYQYKLEGFDEDWVLTNQLRVNYTNLAPGNYTLKSVILAIKWKMGSLRK